MTEPKRAGNDLAEWLRMGLALAGIVLAGAGGWLLAPSTGLILAGAMAYAIALIGTLRAR